MRRPLPMLASFALLAAAACGDASDPVRPSAAPLTDAVPAWADVVGYATTTARGIPLPGVTVTESATGVSATTDPAGGYALYRLQLGWTKLTLSRLPAGCVIPAPVPVEVFDHQTETVDLSADCAETVSGVVRVATGEQLQSSIVLASEKGTPSFPAKNGVYSIPGVPVGGAVLRVVENLPNLNCSSEDYSLQVPFADVAFDLKVDCTLAVPVQALDGGTQIVGAKVSVLDQVGLTNGSSSVPVLNAVPLGFQTFTVAADGCPATKTSRQVGLANIGVAYVFDLRCFGTVSGKVTDRRGTPLVGVGVAVAGVQAFTDKDGLFTLASVPTGKYPVELSALPKGCVPPSTTAGVTRAATSTVNVAVGCP